MAAGKKWAYADRLGAAMAYIMTGNATAAEKLCGIPKRTIRDWVHEPWWGELITEAKKRKNQELDARLTKIIHTGVGLIIDRFEKGDSRVNKHGELINVPVSARDVAWITGVMTDKRSAIRGDAGKGDKPPVSSTEKLDQIRGHLQEMGTAAKKDSKVH